MPAYYQASTCAKQSINPPGIVEEGQGGLMKRGPCRTRVFLPFLVHHLGEICVFFPPLVKGGRRGGGQRATRHSEINSLRHLGESSVYFPPLVKGGRRGGGQRATRHGEIPGMGVWARRYQWQNVQS